MRTAGSKLNAILNFNLPDTPKHSSVTLAHLRIRHKEIGASELYRVYLLSGEVNPLR